MQIFNYNIKDLKSYIKYYNIEAYEDISNFISQSTNKLNKNILMNSGFVNQLIYYKHQYNKKTIRYILYDILDNTLNNYESTDNIYNTILIILLLYFKIPISKNKLLVLGLYYIFYNKRIPQEYIFHINILLYKLKYKKEINFFKYIFMMIPENIKSMNNTIDLLKLLVIIYSRNNITISDYELYNNIRRFNNQLIDNIIYDGIILYNHNISHIFLSILHYNIEYISKIYYNRISFKFYNSNNYFDVNIGWRANENIPIPIFDPETGVITNIEKFKSSDDSIIHYQWTKFTDDHTLYDFDDICDIAIGRDTINNIDFNKLIECNQKFDSLPDYIKYLYLLIILVLDKISYLIIYMQGMNIAYINYLLPHIVHSSYFTKILFNLRKYEMINISDIYEYMIYNKPLRGYNMDIEMIYNNLVRLTANKIKEVPLGGNFES